MIENFTIRNTHNRGAYKLERFIAKAYIYCLTIRMISPLAFLYGYVGAVANYFDVVLHAIGLLIILFNGGFKLRRSNNESTRLLYFFFCVIFCFNLTSFIASIFINAQFGSIGSENSFRATFIMGVYFIHYALMLIYNKHVFSLFTKEELYKLLYRSTVVLLILGYIQIILMITNNNFLMDVYDHIDFLDILPKGNFPKLSLTGKEGASAGCIISIYVFPILLGKICFSKTSKFKDWLMILLWMPVILFTKSSTAYVLAFIVIVVFLCINIFALKRLLFLIPILLLLAVYLLLPGFGGVIKEMTGIDIQYLLFERVTSWTDSSSASRSVPFYINWGAFTEMPIFGVGNGNQGFFFFKYFPMELLDTPGSDIGVFYNRSYENIANGALFFPSLLSGYGLFGVFLFACFVLKALNLVYHNKKNMGVFYYMVFISWMAFFVAGFQGDYIGNYYPWFMISLPFIINAKNPRMKEYVVNKGPYRLNLVKN